MATDFYPRSIDARVPWHTNFGGKLPAYAAKYNITSAQVLSATHDQAWMETMGVSRNSFDTFSQKMTKYFNDIAGNDPSLNPPEALAFTLIIPSEERKPGIEFRTREIARQIKGHTDYSAADGEDLGIVAPVGAVLPPHPPTIDVFAADSNFEFSVVVTGRGGADMWECMVRPVGATPWHSIGSRSGKSGDFHYVPTNIPDEPTPIQLQVRVQLKKNDADFNPPSDVKIATVNP